MPATNAAKTAVAKTTTLRRSSSAAPCHYCVLQTFLPPPNGRFGPICVSFSDSKQTGWNEAGFRGMIAQRWHEQFVDSFSGACTDALLYLRAAHHPK